jgi:hypothetical protein
MRRLLLLPLLVLAALAPLSGCGSSFPLPTERPKSSGVPTDSSYAMIATWDGFTDVRDVLLTQGSGTQLFVLFNDGLMENMPPTVPVQPHGELRLYALSKPTIIGAPYFLPLSGLYNPLAVASAQNKLFVLDEGDSCKARYDVRRGTCRPDQDTTSATGHPFRHQIFDWTAIWRVREYGLSGGDTISTFTDTTFAHVMGMAAGEDGYVYVSGIVAVLDTNVLDQRIRTKKFASRVYRYARGPKYTGLVPDSLNDDPNMPGSRWHRDTTWVVLDGSGTASVFEPSGLYYSRYGGHSLFIADRGNGAAKEVSVATNDLGLLKVDGSTTGAIFDQPDDVFADLNGFFYVLDRGNRRVLRYDARSGEYVQRVDIENNAQNEPLLDPISIAADDSLVYVADHDRGKLVKFKRRK